MYRALYRKWRSRDFDEVYGQHQVTDVLKYQVGMGKISHAYLFCGSRGTGKTSCAKILAKAVNCKSPRNGNPCNECEACRSIDNGTAVDVIEMDAASNNGVDNVRDMKEEISFSPAQFAYRVYIIDEVHMMSPSAFNALLKTLEEPPAHVLFILATTELQKLPSTIISRCQRFDFRRLSTRVICDRLTYIAEQEKIKIEPSAVRLIARMAQGGMRDAISLFELCASCASEVTVESATELLGVGSREEMYAVIRAVSERNYEKLYHLIDETVLSGGDLSVYWLNLIETYRDLLVVSVLETAKDYLDLTDHEYDTLKELSARFTMPALYSHIRALEEAATQMQRASVPKRCIAEITLTRLCDPRLSADSDNLLLRIEALERELTALRLSPQTVASVQASPVKQEKSKEKPRQKEITSPQASSSPYFDSPVKGWREAVNRFEEQKPPYKGTLRTAVASLSPKGGLRITLQNDFMGGLLMHDEAAVRLLLAYVSEADPRCLVSIPVEWNNGAPKTEEENIAF